MTPAALVIIGALAAQVLVAPTGEPRPGSGLAGWWRLESTTGTELAGYSTPTRIVITESATDVTIQSNTATGSQMQTAVYTLDGSESPVPGLLGETRASAIRQDGRLIVSIRRSIDGPDGKREFDIREVYTVTGVTMTLDRSQGTRTQKMVFTKVP